MRNIKNLSSISIHLMVMSLLFLSSSAHSKITALDIVALVLKNSISEDSAKTAKGGREICLANGRPSYECNSSTTFPQGICLASNRPSYECSSYISLSEGICLSGGRPKYECSSYKTINEAICLSTGRQSYECSSHVSTIQAICLARGSAAYKCSSYMSIEDVLSMPVQDIVWAWDQIVDQYGALQWFCRGRITGQFSELNHCGSEEQNDEIWPGPNP